MTAAAAVALAAALVACGAAAVAFVLVRRARASARPLEREIERGKATFAEVMAREAARGADDLERQLAMARTDAMSALANEERRIAEARRREVAERERDASAKLIDALTTAQARVEERLTQWGGDLTQLQESLAAEIARLSLRQQQLTSQVEARIEADADRQHASLEEHRVLIAKLRDDLNRSAEEVAKAAAVDLEQHAAERRAALNEVAERLRRRERELTDQIEREHADAMQRVAVQLGDVEHRQLEALRRTVSREATRYAEAAAQQFEATIRTAREDAARRLGRELDLAVERFAREADGVLAERVDHVADAAVKRVEARLANLGAGLDRRRDEALVTLERTAHEVEQRLRARLDDIAAEAEAERVAIETRLHELHRRLEELAARS